MKRIILLLAVFATTWAAADAAPALTNRVLIIDPSSTPVAAGRATLTIGALQRTGDIYGGSYQMKVSPYFLKSEKGRLAIVVSDKSIAQVTNGLTAEITGTATSSGKGGKTRRIDAIATPADTQRGALTLWFIAGDRKMVFDTSYRFIEP